MKIGILKEIKDQEFCVGLIFVSVKVCIEVGNEVFIEIEVGWGVGFSDSDYFNVGGYILLDIRDVWKCDMIVKVKEFLFLEYEFFKLE